VVKAGERWCNGCVYPRPALRFSDDEASRDPSPARLSASPAPAQLHTFAMQFSVATLATLASTASAARFLLQIPTTALLNPSTLPSTTHATLQSSGPPLDAYLTRSNTFNFANVSAGSYLATVHCRDYVFEPLRIDISLEEAVEGSGEKREVVKAWQTFLGNEWDNKGESRGEGGNGLVVEAKIVATKYFYQERGGCEFTQGPRRHMVGANKHSLAAVLLEESHDPHGSRVYGLDVRYAQVNGEQYVTKAHILD
jgi:hypothetical protein